MARSKENRRIAERDIADGTFPLLDTQGRPVLRGWRFVRHDPIAAYLYYEIDS